MVKGVISKFAACAIAVLLMAGSAFAAATISAPANGSKLGELPTFTVAKEPGQEYCWVYVGTTGAGSYNLGSQSIDNATSFTLPGLPADNSTIYVRVWTRLGGSYQGFQDYTYTARWSATGESDCAAITSPENNGSVIYQGQSFSLEDVGATKYWVYVGDIGPGSYNLSTFTNLTKTTFFLKNLPADKTIYIRLWTIFGPFKGYRDFTYNTDAAFMTYPANGARLDKPAEFTWADTGADWYWLYIGSTKGGYQYYSVNQGTNLSATVPGLPSDNSTVYVRLWNRQGTNYTYNDYTYTANGTGTTDLAQITTPANDNDTLDNSTGSIALVWDNATYATKYHIYVGSTPGAFDYFTKDVGSALSVTLPASLPGNSQIYVRLWTISGLFRKYTDSFYMTP